MKKIKFKFIIIEIFFVLNIFYSNEITTTMYETILYFFKNILPTMFPLLITTNYLQKNILPYIKSKIIRFVILSTTFAPANAVASINKNELLYSSIVNPLFSFNMINMIIKNNKITFVIILINILFNNIFLYKNLENKNIDEKTINKENLSAIINKSFLQIINILSTILFFNIISTISAKIFSKYIIISLEITNAFLIINNINSYTFKIILCTFINSFCGLSIIMQIKSINNDANYLFFIKKFIISCIVTILTYLIILRML